MRLLLADDTLDTRQLYALVFTLDRHTVVLAEDGHQAIQAVEANVFDVIIMDVYMPGLDGLSAIQRIRTLPNGRTVPIIVITAYDCTEQAAHEAGANLLLKKPILLRALVQHVERLHAAHRGA